jgi:hypothetical protein
MTILGTTLFSLTPDWRAGADATAILERVADARCGPAIEVIGHQTWRGFPEMATDDERAFRDAVDRLGLVPVSLGVYTDLFRRPDRPMTTDEAFADIRPQLQAAARLGFPVVRASLGMESALLRRVAAECDHLGVVLTFEIQGVTPPDAPAVAEVVALQAETGSPYLGFTIDFSLTTPALPVAFGTALRRLGLPEPSVAAIVEIWDRDEPLGARIGAARAELAGRPDEAALTMVVAGVFGRTGRWQPADWAALLPLTRHAHAKFWDPDVEAVREPHGAWLTALADAGYSGAVVSEWGGHELLDSGDADALTTTRAHVELLRELSSNRSVATA